MTAAVLFQNMPPLSPEEYAALESSIREHGIQVPVQVDEHGVVIDGHHRTKIADELGIDCPKAVVRGKTDAEKRTLALSLNLDRRHLSRDQRRALIAESIKADPQLPDYQHAKRTGASDKTVTSVRRDLEAHSEIPNDVPRINARGQERPASYRPRDLPPFDPAAGEALDESTPADAAPSSAWDSEPVDFERATAEFAEAVDVDPVEAVEHYRENLRNGITDEPGSPAPKKPRRRPITDQFFDAAHDLRKVTERLVRICDEDRFPQNAEKVATANRSDLLRARDALDGVLSRLPETN